MRMFISIIPRAHIHGSLASFTTDHPENANFRSLIRMHKGVATSLDVSTKDKVGKEHFGDMSDTLCYFLIWNATVK